MHHLLAPHTSPLGLALAQALDADLHHYHDAPLLTRHPWVGILLPTPDTPDALGQAQEAAIALRHLAYTGGVVLSNADVFDAQSWGIRREAAAPDATDTFGQALRGLEQLARGKPVLRAPTPLVSCPEAAPVVEILHQDALPHGALQAIHLDEIAQAARRANLPTLVHLACGPVPTETLADALGKEMVEGHGKGRGWDRLRSDWSEMWGRPDGLISGRRDHIQGMLALARTTPA